MKRRIAVVSICLIAVLLLCLSSCSKAEFKLNFVVDDETYATVATGGNETIKMPDDPTKEGYTFDGWYWDKDVWQKPFTANSLLDAPLSSDMSVYAKFTLADTKEPENQEPNTTPLQNCELASNHLTVFQTDVTGKVSSQIESFSFLADVKVANGASYTVCTDIGCTQTVPSKTVNLAIGDNTFYILVTNADQMQLYTVTIRRLPVYTVSFETHGGTVVDSQTVEEGGFASKPADPIKSGYTFGGWNINIDSAITGNTEFSAIWNANTDTAYKVEYYLENVSKNGYELKETKNLTGSTGATANADKKLFEHFTLDSSKSTTSGKINAEGSLVLQLYYTRNVYNVAVNVEHDKSGTVTNGGVYPYGTEITLVATVNEGYSFVGFISGQHNLSTSTTYTFTVDKSVNIVMIATPNNTTYKVEYYIQNLAKTGYEIKESITLTGATDSTVSVEAKSFDHFTFNPSDSILSGIVSGNGSLVLKVYYTRNSYTVTKANGGTITGGGTYPYGTRITVTSTPKFGFNFLGWYSGNTFITTESEYSCEISSNLIAKYEEWPEMSNFIYTSSSTTCEITGVKDTSVESIVVPDYVTKISNGAFKNCNNLVSITIPFVGGSSNASGYSGHFGYIFGYTRSSNYSDTFHYNDENYYYTFNIPSTLTTVIISNEATAISDQSFKGCQNLTNITFGNGVTNIEEHAFFGCTSLTTLNFGNSVTSIGDYAFSGCSALTIVVLPDTVKSIGFRGFADCTKLTSITLGANFETLGQYVFHGCTKLTGIDVVSNNLNLISINGVLYSKNQQTLVLYPFGKTETTFIMPDSVTSIAREAFYDCTTIQYVQFSANLTSIGSGAFSGCTKLSSLVLPDNLKSIGDAAFSFCSNLSSVTLGDKVTSIGGEAFYKCTRLASIKYKGSQAQWNSITKGYYWKQGAGSCTLTYNYTGE